MDLRVKIGYSNQVNIQMEIKMARTIEQIAETKKAHELDWVGGPVTHKTDFFDHDIGILFGATNLRSLFALPSRHCDGFAFK